MAAVHLASPIDANGVVRCYQHGLEAVLLTSHTSTNPNRQFYRCRKDRTDPDHCDFFYWADQLHHEQNLTSPASHTASQSPTTPQFGSYIPTTPRKRSFDSTFPLTPSSSQKRKKIIEQALGDQSILTQSKSQTRVVQSTLKHDEESDNDDAMTVLLTPPSGLPNSKNRPSERSQNSDDPFVVLTPQDSQPAGGSSTMYDPPGRGAELSPDAISTLLSAMDGIPEYVRKLERQRIAAEKSCDAKAKKITELEAEVQKLKERNSALQNAIKLLGST